ncbi:MAG: hypothetical protein Gyms2KO_40240 [Gymnodinialimonas sp.]
MTEPWKRGLLKAWLALSLLWAVAFTLFVVVGSLGVFENAPRWQTRGIATATILLFALPLAALPPLLILALGSLIVWIIDRYTSRTADE